MPTRFLVLLIGAVALLAASAPVSHARSACVDDILDEWVNPSTSIAASHPLKCYDLALKEAPEDVLLYTNFETDVRTAKRIALRSKQTSTSTSEASPSGAAAPPSSQPPNPPPANPAPTPAPVDSVQPPQENAQGQNLEIEPEQPAERTLDATAPIDPLTIEPPQAVEEVVPLEEPLPPAPIESEAVDAPVIDALRNIGPDDASSVPVPLIVLTILSGMLALIGATLLAARHMQAKRLSQAPPLPPNGAGSGSNEPPS